MVVWGDDDKINNIADWLLLAILHTTLTTALFVFKIHRDVTVNVILYTFIRKVGLFVWPFFRTQMLHGIISVFLIPNSPILVKKKCKMREYSLYFLGFIFYQCIYGFIPVC